MKNLIIILTAFIFYSCGDDDQLNIIEEEPKIEEESNIEEEKLTISSLWGYGLLGGENNAGFIYKTDGSGRNLEIVHHFIEDALGKNPKGNLVKGPDGLLYGIARGGTNDKGILFSINPNDNTFAIHYHFVSGSPTGSLVLASNGNFYGFLSGGYGKIYEFNPETSTFTEVHAFNKSDGRSIYDHTMIELLDNILYGVAAYGGTYDEGVIFKYDINTSTYDIQYEFDGLNGNHPKSIFQASSGILYGIAGGGANKRGVIYEFNQSTKKITTTHDFTKDYGIVLGGLLEASDGNYYGVSSIGGVHDHGAFYKFDPKEGQATFIHEFASSGANIPEANVMEAKNGNIYGTTRYGGSGLGGTIYEYNISMDVFQIIESVGNGYPTGNKLL